MKTHFKLYLILIAIISGFSVYSITTNVDLNFSKMLGSVEEHSKTSTLLATNQDILGAWVLENDPTTRFVFGSNNMLRIYRNNVLQSTEPYFISTTCNGKLALPEEAFLKITDEYGITTCDVILGADVNGNGILSIMSESQGKIVVFVRP
ncbi:MAG TPA: hypothetical protein VF581_05620 [Flavobacterium sp.]|jgi:hypothetical protein